MCVHETPLVSEFDRTANAQSALLYRVEYHTALKGLWKLWELHGKDVPCAVCQTTDSLATLMQPGSEICPSGWSTEYRGYIMSSAAGERRSEFVCVDGQPTHAPGGDNATNTYAARMSPVELQHEAGNEIASNSYSEYAELMCAVCSEPKPTLSCPALLKTVLC